VSNVFNPAPGYVLIPSPPALPPRVSLLTSADVITDDSRWVGGYGWVPESVDVAYGPNPIDCTEDDIPTVRQCNAIQVRPFAIVGRDAGSTFERKTRDFYSRATRNLIASEAYIIEQQFMVNTLNLETPYVLDPAAPNMTTVTTAPLAPWHALANVEQAASQIIGERIYIHVRPHILIELAAATLIRREGNVWLTPMDSIVVPGRGYPGTGPNGEPVAPGSEWMYATGRVEIRRSEVMVFPEQDTVTDQNPFGVPASAVNRQTNDIAVTAQRIVSVAFNSYAGVVAAEVDNEQSVWGSDPTP